MCIFNNLAGERTTRIKADKYTHKDYLEISLQILKSLTSSYTSHPKN
jgi:hypothetical protein